MSIPERIWKAIVKEVKQLPLTIFMTLYYITNILSICKFVYWTLTTIRTSYPALLALFGAVILATMYGHFCHKHTSGPYKEKVACRCWGLVFYLTFISFFAYYAMGVPYYKAFYNLYDGIIFLIWDTNWLVVFIVILVNLLEYNIKR